MAASSAAAPAAFPAPSPRFSLRTPQPEPNTEAIKQRLLRRGVSPTPKILHALRKKEAQKAARRSKKQALEAESPPLTDAQKQLVEEEALFRTISREYRVVREELDVRIGGRDVLAMARRPWERAESADGVDLSGIRSSREEYDGGKLKGEHLEELREMLAERNGEKFHWVLDDDIEEGDEEGGRVTYVDRWNRFTWNQRNGDQEKIRWLISRLNSTNLSIQDWKFPRLMKQSGLLFTENSLLKILEELGAQGNWKQALSVVEWVYKEREYRRSKSRFVYTKLLSILGKQRRATEALRFFNMMRDDCQIYPDMAAYHSIAVTLGQAGLVKELINIVEGMKQKPTKKLKNMRSKNWDPCLEPDVIVYNAVLNACVPTRQWKGVSWVLQQMRSSDLKPTGATYGLAMEVMLEAGKYDNVHKLFGTMQRSGLALKATTYKVLVRAFWKEGKVDEAIRAVREMEQRGIVGAGNVYYELACCLCNNGMWKEAMLEVEKLKRLPLTKPLEVAFTGMIMSSMDGGHLHDCISTFRHMKDHCVPNIGTINAVLKVYNRIDMFANAKELFEAAKAVKCDFDMYPDVAKALTPDSYSYSLMLEASATSHQWEYFEYLYKEMALCGYQLDQNKHARLLVKASRAGKWHLLEHAFDTILEAGEIPHISLFTEMLCQAVAQENYERAVPLLDSMAHASMEVSERQWTNLFEKNGDRFDKDKLQGFLSFLGDNNIITEDPVSNLMKSLQFLCFRSKRSMDKYSSPSDVLKGESTTDSHGIIKHFNDDATFTVSGVVANKLIPHQNHRGMKIETNEMQYHRPARTLMGENDNNEPCGGNELDNLDISVDVITPTFPADFVADKELGSTSHYSLEASVTEETIESLTGHIDSAVATYCSELPSASEILESWKQNRIKDGIFPFQI